MKKQTISFIKTPTVIQFHAENGYYMEAVLFGKAEVNDHADMYLCHNGRPLKWNLCTLPYADIDELHSFASSNLSALITKYEEILAAVTSQKKGEQE